MKRLIYDIYSTGHHSEYIEHLIVYIVANAAKCKPHVFLLAEDFKTKFPQIIELGSNCNKIEFVFITEAEKNLATSGSLLSQSFKQLELVKKYCKSLQITDALLMHINVLQIALCFKRTPFKISGILFSQFTRQSTEGNFKEKLRYIRRYLQTYLIAKNKQIEKIYILNDVKSCEYLNNKFNTNIFQFLPDPLPNLDIEEPLDVRGIYKINGNRRIFVHFGSLSDRKGTFDILEGLHLVAPEDQQKMALIIAGRPTGSSDADIIAKHLSRLEKEGNQVKIVFESGFVSNNLKNNIFHQSDFVLIPYKNVEASSGILGHAVMAGKPVISTGKGLLKEIIEDNHLGFLINEVTPTSIAAVMSYVLTATYGIQPPHDYIEKNSALYFATKLLAKKMTH